MAVPPEHPWSLRAVIARNSSTLSCILLVLSVLLGAALDRNLPLAVYLLSFWHYYLYWLAFAFGAIPFDVFKRDAMAMKTVAVTLLATVFLAAPIDIVSLAVVGGGILLNARAAIVLGVDRTYYGHEVAGLPLQRTTDFPYSLTSHPMILGNIAAFGGTMINPAFSEHWWPLAGLHVGLNIGLLAMELAGTQRRAVRIGGAVVFVGITVAAAFAALGSGRILTVPTALAGLAAVTCAWTLHRRSAPPLPQETARRTP